MASVTQRINEIVQPYGGYVRLSAFDKTQFEDGVTLNAEENVSGSLMGTAADYLTRLAVSGKTIGQVYSGATLRGILMAEACYKESNGVIGIKDALEIAKSLMRQIKGGDDDTLTAILKLATFDLWYRNTQAAIRAETYEAVNPDKATLQNLLTFGKRSKAFFEKYGPITATEFTFEPSGYTETVEAGDGDYLTADTLWDMKLYRGKLTSKHTLQVLMYWIMGQHSGQEIFKGITKIGLYNPRQNVAYTLEVAKIPPEVIREVEEKVICYRDREN